MIRGIELVTTASVEVAALQVQIIFDSPQTERAAWID